MQRPLRRPIRTALLLVGVVLCALAPAAAHAARVGVLSNKNFNETAGDFGSKIQTHTFTGVDVSSGPPSLSRLLQDFDVLLLFEDGTFSQAPAVGTVVAQFAETGRPVVLGTFYDQDRSDGPIDFTPHGWGDLELIDPNTTDGVGTTYQTRTLGSVVTHPLTTGVTSLMSAKFAGGNQAKPATIVVATWAQKNALGNPDPVAAYRITGAACVIHIAIAPDYPTVGIPGTDFSGDFYRLWRNAFDFAANRCVTGTAQLPLSQAVAIPASSWPALALGATLLLGFAMRRLSRRPRRAR
ncbi:MAG TPA: hypothetical protein VMB76_06970 [Casimicrobiaceae bacterium]|jgi:hypothetical protein|nr:hypothetical protein [Casimicrobiaceae bacterium]